MELLRQCRGYVIIRIAISRISSDQITSLQQADVVQLGTRPEVFVTVESHEMTDVEDVKKAPSRFEDGDSDHHQGFPSKVWDGPDQKNGSLTTAV